MRDEQCGRWVVGGGGDRLVVGCGSGWFMCNNYLSAV